MFWLAKRILSKITIRHLRLILTPMTCLCARWNWVQRGNRTPPAERRRSFVVGERLI
jgi:hypothetical protein